MGQRGGEVGADSKTRLREGELTLGSQTSAFKTQTPGNNPEDYTLYSQHGESLKSTECNSVALPVLMSLQLGRLTICSDKVRALLPAERDFITSRRKTCFLSCTQTDPANYPANHPKSIQVSLGRAKSDGA
jgi:hypothetical protein